MVYNHVDRKTAAFQLHSCGYGGAWFVGLLEKALTQDARRRLRFDVHGTPQMCYACMSLMSHFVDVCH